MTHDTLQIAVVNMKGGVGKTTTAVHVAAGLALAGARTLLVDADPQGNVGHAFGVHRERTITDLMRDTATLDDVIARDVRPGLDILPSTPAAFALESELAGAPQRETLLSRRLRPLAGYGAVIFDCSPAMSLLTYNVLLYASDLIVPVGMDSMAIIGARQTLAGVREIRELWPERRLDVLAVLPIAVNGATNATRAAFDALDRDPELATRLYRPGIRQCIDVTYAFTQQQTIWEYAPNSRAAEDYGGFVRFVARERRRSHEAARPHTAQETPVL